MSIESITGELSDEALRGLELRLWRDEDVDTYVALLEKHHYLGCPDARKRHLCQVVCHEGKAVALVVWTTASPKLAGREAYLRWDARTRQKRLSWLVQNNRFLLLPSKRPSNLASRVLGMAVKALPQAWEDRYGKRPLLAETFVDPEGYKGTCYNAAGWINCGRTAGYARVSGRDFYQDNEHPKNLWLKPLSRDALDRLRDPSRLLPGEDPKARVPGAMPVKAKQAESLSKALRTVKDSRSRRGREYPLGAMLATTVLALCCGAKTVSDIFRFCQDLTSAQRRSLGFRSKPAAPRVVAPPGEGCWRTVLASVDPAELAKALNGWLQAQSKNGTLPELLSIDGKVIGNNLATLVSLVDARDGSPVAQEAAPGNGQEQKLTKQLVEALPEGALEGKTVKGDALYSNKNLVREIVQERGGDVLVQLKANQKTTLEEVTRRLSHTAPPFCTHR
ncbi:Druantia anti-phage system protein DruA [Thalassobacterium maritimum]|uniref:Druantia anti-phage system protein DruA n=1 Tax=Thalassobacterium maritimum TaxID=3041265 RepID=UPI003CE4D738